MFFTKSSSNGDGDATDRMHERMLFTSELISLRAEIGKLTALLGASQAHGDWLRLRVNALEQERAALLLKQAGIYVPIPQIQRQDEQPQPLDKGEHDFETVGNEVDE